MPTPAFYEFKSDDSDATIIYRPGPPRVLAIDGFGGADREWREGDVEVVQIPLGLLVTGRIEDEPNLADVFGIVIPVVDVDDAHVVELIAWQFKASRSKRRATENTYSSTHGFELIRGRAAGAS